MHIESIQISGDNGNDISAVINCRVPREQIVHFRRVYLKIKRNHYSRCFNDRLFGFVKCDGSTKIIRVI